MACKAAHTGSIPVPASVMAVASAVLGRLAQGESASLTRKRSEVQILYRPPLDLLVSDVVVNVTFYGLRGLSQRLAAEKKLQAPLSRL